MNKYFVHIKIYKSYFIQLPEFLGGVSLYFNFIKDCKSEIVESEDGESAFEKVKNYINLEKQKEKNRGLDFIIECINKL